MPENEKAPGSVEELIRALGTDMGKGFQAVGARLTDFENAVGKRLGALETRVDGIEKRPGGTTSIRVKEIAAGVASDADLTNAAQLAEQLTAHKELATKVDALTATVTSVDGKQNAQLAILRILQRASRSRAVQRALAVIVTAGSTWLAFHLAPPGQVAAPAQVPAIATPAK